jgi:3-oxoadipate enol-lactonase
VERACRTCNEEGVALLGILDADATVRAHLSTADLERLLDPRNYTGAAAHFIDRALSARGQHAPVAHGAAVQESSESFVDVDGARIHCRVDGAVGAPVLVLSNSLGADLSMWDDQFAALVSRFRIVRYDTRGHGSSTATPGPYAIERLGRDVVDLLDGLGIERAHFCGLSLGGLTGMWLGVHAPRRVRRLILANTAARIGPPDNWNARIDKVRVGGVSAISQAIVERWFTASYIASHPQRVMAMREMMERTPAEGYVACCAAVRDADLREAVAGIEAPTLVIAGSHDIATPTSEGRFLADRIEGAAYVELAAAHISNIEAAPAFTDALLAFLDT